MPRVLVVDDSPVERKLAVRLLQQCESWEIREASDGKEALDWLQKESFTLILSDICMPEMGGLELLDQVNLRYPGLPLVAMTSQGSEELAVSALEQGAASYLPKRLIGRDLIEVVHRVLEASQEVRKHDKLQQSLTCCQQVYQLTNDLPLVSSIVQEVQKLAGRLGQVGQGTLIQIGVAIEEAVLNAMIHGNLEVSSELRERPDNAFYDLIHARSRQEPYKDRRVQFQIRISPEELHLIIRDEGPGFDVSKLPDPTDTDRLGLSSGRGILLMRAFMDEVEYDANGNQVTMRKLFEKPVSTDEVSEQELLCTTTA
ncbi:MAG: ATP-binding protein [Planctomycetaceae bacterium]|nr:ATP-binding protein [Planctomycetaceae bacterium]